VRWAALALVGLALTGCETSAEKSAKLEREAKLHVAPAAQKGLSITRPSTQVAIRSATLVNGSEGTAAVVVLRNNTSRALHDVPLAISVRNAHGAVVYANSAAGLARTLVSVPLIPAHGEVTWVDDQVQARSGSAVSITAEAGQAPGASGAIPRITVDGAHLYEDQTNGIGAEGTVTNHSALEQRELVVYAVALRSGHVVAAGRAVVPSAPAGAATPFQVFFVGEPKGARLQVSAPPTILR